jgi:hypothetical protein
MPISAPPTYPVPPANGKVYDIVYDALLEIGAVAQGEPLDAAVGAQALRVLNRIVDSWTAKRVYITGVALTSKNPDNSNWLLHPGLVAATIGPDMAAVGQTVQPTYKIAGSRPVRISNANVILNTTNPPTRNPITPRDSDWWANQRVQTIQTSLPTDFYYRTDWPYGTIFLWPVPNFAYGVEFEIENVIDGFNTLGDTFSAPTGYPLALELTLAEMLCASFERQPAPTLIASAQSARNAVQGLNAQPPRISLNEFQSSLGRPLPTFNYRSGSTR